MSGARVEIRRLSLNFGDEVLFHDADLTIEPGEVVALLGTSGSGKTSLLRFVAGLLSSGQGSVLIDGVDITSRSPEQRGIAMLFQKPALFGGMTVLENALATKRSLGMSKKDLAVEKSKVLKAIEYFGLSEHASKKVERLSGGQVQRSAIIRFLSNSGRKRLLLLDEPFQSNMSLAVRWKAMAWFRDWQSAERITTIIVTHDFAEAAYLASQIAFIDRDNKLVTCEAEELYQFPPCLTGAELSGHVNKWELSNDHHQRLLINEINPPPNLSREARWIIVRPSNVMLNRENMEFCVVSRTPMGGHARVQMVSRVDENFHIDADIPINSDFSEGESCGVLVDPDDVCFYCKSGRIISRN